jgi:hypothetical protein
MIEARKRGHAEKLAKGKRNLAQVRVSKYDLSPWAMGTHVSDGGSRFGELRGSHSQLVEESRFAGAIGASDYN